MSLLTPGPAWLFCPADRPERYEKAAAAADVAILDLEDGVAPADKPAARLALRRALRGHELDPARTVVRINPEGPEQSLDLETLAGTGYTSVMLAKAESGAQVAALSAFEVVAIAETPRGVLAAADIAAAPNTVGMLWGAEDLIAGLGGGSSRGPDGSYRDVVRHTRSTVLLAAATSGRFTLDAVHLDIADLDGLRAEVLDAAASGFAGTACIHPTQVAVVRAGFRPDPEDVEAARRMLAAADGERGVFAFEGRMVDEPLLRHARTILARADPG